MAYKCKSCEKEETLYNGRDGVTPFVIECKFCGGEAKHVRWNEDEQDTRHIPEHGDRIFVTMTEEVAWVYARMRMKRIRDHGGKLAPATDEDAIQVEEALVEHLLHEGEGPCIFTL